MEKESVFVSRTCMLIIHFVLRDYNTSVGNPEWNLMEFSTIGRGADDIIIQVCDKEWSFCIHMKTRSVPAVHYENDCGVSKIIL
jgi:hypothetical protein